MVNVFQIIALIICCHNMREQHQQNKIMNDEHQRMKEYIEKKRADNIEVKVPNNKED